MPKIKIKINESFVNFVLIFVLFGVLTACETTQPVIEPVKPIAQPKQEAQLPSAVPLKSVSESDVIFAQTALKQLGFNPGFADGIWGDRSANAMRAFETRQNLQSAGGKLSALNLYSLSKNTKVLRSAIKSRKRFKAPAKPKTILNNLAATESQSSSEQLIILEAAYPLLAKPNPYSEVVKTLPAGTGVYVLERQGEWFKIESLEEDLGFIKDNPLP